ncbi:MAG: hypothetical protein A2W17_02600 [Planctomycetes bacterium RBG_16_41_13]|nr:MAG: hypothetical protein A2W17_02600 [Planctomycetes bacterium RBG_16_41_13]
MAIVKGKVLVADDDMNLRKVIGLFLENAGYKVIEARNGKEAVELTNENMPDAIILDVMMPVMDGFSACTQLKESADTKHIPIIMCTARSRKEDIVSAIKGGAEDYIVKPFTKDILLQKVDKVIKLKVKSDTAKVAVGDKRESPRKHTRWTISWGARIGGAEKLPVEYKSRVLNISLKGLAFEFNRCETCTGYEKDSVHPQCLLAPYAFRFKEAQQLDLVLSISKDIIIETKGKIAHVYQPPETPKTEVVGVNFIALSSADKKLIDDYLAGKLTVAV